MPLPEDHEGLRFGQAPLILPTYDADLPHRRMGKQAVLDLQRRDEDARDLQHLVGAPPVVKETLRVPAELVSGDAPVPAEGLARLCAVPPVTQCRGATPDPQRPLLSGRHLFAAGSDDPRLVARNQFAEAPRPDLAEAVGDGTSPPSRSRRGSPRRRSASSGGTAREGGLPRPRGRPAARRGPVQVRPASRASR